jgi:N-acetyltransferase
VVVRSALEPFVLEGHLVRLEPLREAHVAGLAEAASGDRSTFTLTWVPHGHEEAQRYVQAALRAQAAGDVLPFAQVDRASGRVVGSTRFMALEWWDRPGANGLPDVAEIGSTWLSSSVQRTGINTEAKVLLMAHAFDVWQVQRLFWKTDARNERSRAGIARLGATFEGILRHHMPSAPDPDVPRDSAYYSMLPSEWPAARESLEWRLRP